MNPLAQRPPARDPERGAALVVALIALVALLGIGGVTVLAVQSEVASSGQSRFQNIALDAAEIGVAVGLEFLRNHCRERTFFSQLVEPGNAGAQTPLAIVGNTARPGVAGNLFSPDLGAWYEVTILNNEYDVGLAAGDDTDAQVVLRVTGHGPNNTSVTIEAEVRNASCVDASPTSGGSTGAATAPFSLVGWRQL
jgi:hypothetical protein